MTPTLPLSSMLDVIFLLLAFFIIATTFRDNESKIDVSLPAAESDRAPAHAGTHITITIKSDGKIQIGDTVHTFDSLKATLGELVKQYPDESVLIRGDRESSLGTSVKVMDLAYSVGLKNVYLATTKGKPE